MMNSGLEKLAREAHEERLMTDAQGTMETIFNHVANGGTLTGLCEVWEVRWYKIRAWINADEDRKRTYSEARTARKEWVEDQVLKNLIDLGGSDIRKIFDKDGKLLSPHNLDSATASAVSQYEDDGKSRKIKLADKRGALELLGKTNAMFVDKHEHSVDKTLEDLVAGSMKASDGEPDK